MGYGILGGLTSAYTGAQEGVAERKKLERQALQQQLADMLLKTQVQNLQSQIAARNKPPTPPQPHRSFYGGNETLPPGFADLNTGQYIPLPGAQAKPVAPKAPVMGSPEWLAAQAAGARARASATQDAKEHAPLTPAERDAAQRALDAVREMKSQYKGDKDAPSTSMLTAVAQGTTHALDKVGLGGLTAPIAQSSRSNAQAAFQRAATQLRHNLAAIQAHSRMQMGLIEDFNKAYVPPSGTSDETIAEAFATEWDRLEQQLSRAVGETPRNLAAPTGGQASRKRSLSELEAQFGLGK